MNIENGTDFLVKAGLKVHNQGLEKFSLEGLPGKKYEEYKFTYVKGMIEKTLDGSDFAGNEDPGELKLEDLVQTPYQLTFYNGRLISEFGSNDLMEVQGLEELPTDERFHPEWEDPYHLMNQAVDVEGKYIRIHRSKTLDQPIYVRYIVDRREDQAVAFSRNYFHIEENAEARIIEEYIYLGEKGSFDNTETHYVLDRAARANSYILQLEGNEQVHVGNTFIQQEKDSNFRNVAITMKGKMVRNNIQISLNEEHTESHLIGFYMLNGKSHVDNHTTVDHRKPNSFSNELYKGILTESSTGVFNGKIYVRPDAQKTNAFQSNNNLLLSDSATLHTKPQLEIWADDVKCSHGCTSGQLDKEAMFYLQTRGLNKEQARALLLKAFASEVTDEIDIESIADKVNGLVDHILFQS